MGPLTAPLLNATPGMQPLRQAIPADLVFGHWAALEGQCPQARTHAIDTGCVWGGTLTALRLQDKQRISVAARDKRS